MQQHGVKDWRGYEVIDADGSKIGMIEDFFVDRVTDRPEWALVNMGLFGTKQTLVPFDGASVEDDRLRVPYDKGVVKDAPGLSPGASISERELADLYSYYRLESPTGAGGAATSSTRPLDTPGPDEGEILERDRAPRETQEDMRERQADLEARQDQLEEREAELETRVDELGDRQADLDRREAQVARREVEAGGRDAHPGERDDELGAQEAERREAARSAPYEGNEPSVGSAGAPESERSAASPDGPDRPVDGEGLGARLRRFGGPS
jgi:sporulation protein YlmC with PRC-barrel domain